jgi:hypothetical protein
MNYRLKDFLPLIVIFSLIIAFTFIRQWYFGFDIANAMYDFMAAFFLIFGFFKIINLAGFAEAYSTYDIVAQRFFAYGYIYPFIEIALGLCYLFRYQLVITNWITFIVMIISSIGVAIELRKQKEITCACLGTVFKIPMTYVTLAEDVIMGLMALYMIVYGL